MSSEKATQTVVTDLAGKAGFLKRLPVKIVILVVAGAALAVATRKIQMSSSDEEILAGLDIVDEA